MRVKAGNFTSAIRFHVGRLHVSTSNAEIETDIRAAIDKSLKSNPEWTMTEATKTACVKYALECHEENRNLYAHVMGGRGK